MPRDSEINVLLAFMLIASFLGAIALHGWWQALVASWLGDDTPRSAGRQNLRLDSHIDPVGLMLAIILSFQQMGVGPVALGWGKPVSVDPWKLRVRPNAGVLIVSCAGIVFSVLVGLIAAVVANVTAPFLLQNWFTEHVLQLLVVFAVTNVALAIFHLIPCYPLDGYQILYTLLPSRQAVGFARSASYGPFIILALFFLLPLIGLLSGAGAFPLFHIAYYIRLIAIDIVNPIAGTVLAHFSVDVSDTIVGNFTVSAVGNIPVVFFYFL